jgi:hypothetical protein
VTLFIQLVYRYLVSPWYTQPEDSMLSYFEHLGRQKAIQENQAAAKRDADYFQRSNINHINRKRVALGLPRIGLDGRVLPGQPTTLPKGGKRHV